MREDFTKPERNEGVGPTRFRRRNELAPPDRLWLGGGELFHARVIVPFFTKSPWAQQIKIFSRASFEA